MPSYRIPALVRAPQGWVVLKGHRANRDPISLSAPVLTCLILAACRSSYVATSWSSSRSIDSLDPGVTLTLQLRP
jgi:hypothetical protein